jgi:kynurenine formamidase
MCEQALKSAAGWQGWLEIPEARLSAGAGPWIDLSHPLSETMPRVPMMDAPSFPKARSQPGDPMNLTEMHMAVHCGTHVDSPYHFIGDGPAFEQIPLDRLYGGGVVWRIEAEPLQVIEPADLEDRQPEIRSGDILLLDTGWADLAGTDRYREHPSLSPAAAEWMVAKRIKLLAVDFGTPDLPPHRRPSNFNWPVHQILLSRGVLVAEHVTNVRPLAGRRVDALFMALNIEGSDGAPARVIARPAA